MKISTLCVLAAIAGICPSVRADEPAIIAKARAYLGPESVLDSVNSIHMVGSLTASPDNSAAPQRMTVDIIIQKPDRESILIVQKDRIIHTALDAFEGSQEAQDKPAPGQTSIDLRKTYRLTILSPEQVESLRVDVLEQIWFYHGPMHEGGQIEDRGSATTDGIATEKIAFVYGPKNTYVRQFDQSTGRLVYSEINGVSKIRQSGEIMAGGIRFPKQIDVTDVINGKDSTKTYTFDKITVNESFPESLFAVPDILPPHQ